MQRPPEPRGGGASAAPDGPAVGHPPTQDQVADVVVVGAGVVGLTVGWRLARSGRRVLVVDPQPGRGASWVAAGMLAPVTEVHYGEEALLALNLAAAACWPAFAAELETALGGRTVGYRRSGTLLVAAEDGDLAFALRLHEFMAELGLDAERLTASAARRLEPALSPALAGALWAPGDHQVDNRMLVRGLLDAVAGEGVGIVSRRAGALTTAGGRVTGIRTEDGAELRAPVVVVAAGVGSAGLRGMAPPAVPPVRPVKGQILRMSTGPEVPRLGRAVRGIVHGDSVYLVPRADGTVVVGATVEERGADTTVTAGAVYELLRDAHRVVPSVTEYVLDEATAGLRPGSPDNAPLVGPVAPAGPEGLVLATGHYRNGMLLAPLTADAVLALVDTGSLPPLWAPFAPGRFAAAGPVPRGGVSH